MNLYIRFSLCIALSSLYIYISIFLVLKYIFYWFCVVQVYNLLCVTQKKQTQQDSTINRAINRAKLVYHGISNTIRTSGLAFCECMSLKYRSDRGKKRIKASQ